MLRSAPPLSLTVPTERLDFMFSFSIGNQSPSAGNAGKLYWAFFGRLDPGARRCRMAYAIAIREE
jgi:hypothetical protein